MLKNNIGIKTKLVFRVIILSIWTDFSGQTVQGRSDFSLISVVHCLLFGKMVFDPLYTGILCHCYILDESTCHFRGVGSILWLLFYI